MKEVAIRWLSWKMLRGLALAYGAAMLVVWLVLLLGWCAGKGPRDSSGEILGPDFPSFYTGAWMLNHSEKHRLYNTMRQREIQRSLGLRPSAPNQNGVSAYVHPPHYAVLVSPLARLPYRTAFFVNTLIMFGCVALALYFLRGKLPPEYSLPTLQTPAGTLLMALALISSPVYYFVSAGQSSGLFLLLHTLILIALCRRREYSAGALIAAGMLKPHLFLGLLPLAAVRRQWKIIASSLVGFALIAIFTFSVFGGDVLRQEMALLGSQLYQGEEVRQAFQMFSWLPFWKLLLGSNIVATLLGALCMIAIYGFLCWLWLRAQNDDVPLRYAMTLCGLCVINPHLPVYDLSLLILPMLIFADRLLRLPRERFVALRGLMLLLIAAAMVYEQSRITHLQIAVPLITAMMFLALPLHREYSERF